MMRLIRILAVLSAVYLCSIAVAYVLQRHLIYFPSGKSIEPKDLGLNGIQPIQLVTSDNERLAAWYSPARGGQPTLFYLHGNAGALSHRAQRIRLYQSHGYGVFVLAYRGFAGSTGRPSERGIIADALQAYDHLTSLGAPETSIAVYGESLGTAVAVRVAAERRPSALILESPFSSAAEVGSYTYPYLPVHWLLEDRFETISFIGKVRAPLLVLHGERDDIVPIRFGRKLYAAAHDPKVAYFLPEATHYTLYDHGAFDKIRLFLDKLRAPSPSQQTITSGPCGEGCAVRK